MIKKKSKFLTFCFSLLPGAGHMYMGFMKQGLSIATIFFTLLFLCTWLSVTPILFGLPIIWLYGFFDATNKSSLSEEEFYSLEDDYLIPIDDANLKNLISRRGFQIGIAVILLFIGGNLLLDAFYQNIVSYLPYVLQNIYHTLSNFIPRLVIGSFILFIGLRLIVGKKNELNEDENNSEGKSIIMPEQYFTETPVVNTYNLSEDDKVNLSKDDSNRE